VELRDLCFEVLEASMVAGQSILLATGQSLTHAEACRVADKAATCGAQIIVIDLGGCCSAATSAFARLVILRRSLLESGRDIRLTGLQGQPARLFEVHRLENVLPRLSNLPNRVAVSPRHRQSRVAETLATAC
jgi:anti-anti-sigma regulatory factor